MPLDNVRWAIEIAANDRSAQGFASFERRLHAADLSLRKFSERERAVAQASAAGYARAAAAVPANSAAAYARIAAMTARTESAGRVARLAAGSGESLAAMYGTAAVAATSLTRAQDRLARSNADLDSGFGLLTRQLVPLTAAFSAAVLVHRAFSAGRAAGDLKDEARQLLLTTDQLQAYRAIAGQAGIASGELDQALVALVRSMGAARDGGDEVIRKFERLGVKLLDARGQLRGPADVLPDLARGLLSVGSESERNALMMDLLGRSGSRMVTVLESWAQGNDRVVESARAQGAIVGPEAIANWDRLNTAIDRGAGNFGALFATLAGPSAGAAADLMGRFARNTERAVGALSNLPQDATVLQKLDAIFGGRGVRPMGVDPADLADARAALERQRLERARQDAAVHRIGPGALEAQRERTEAAEREAHLLARERANRESLDRLMNDGLPARSGGTPGASNPTGKTAGKAAETLDRRLDELRNERAALERALQAFESRGDESAAAIDRRLDAQVKLDKKIFDVLKDVPPNSPLAAQLVQEATAVSQLNRALDERKRRLALEDEARQFIAQQQLERDTLYMGTEAALAYRLEQEAINRAKAEGSALTPELVGHLGELARAQAGAAEQTRRAKEWADFERESFRALFSDINRGLREGANVWDVFANAGMNALNRISDKLMQMAADDLFNAAFGGAGGGAGGGLFSGIGGWIGGLLGGGGSSMGMGAGLGGMHVDAVGGIGYFAEGGDYAAGVPRVVGEKGWELDIPRAPGTILNQRQLRGLLGGGRNVTVYQTFQVGRFVTPDELERAKREMMDAAQAAFLEDIRSGGTTRKIVKG